MSNDYLPTMAGTTAPPAATPKLRLTFLTGSLAGKSQEAQPGVLKIGRHPESQIRFDHTTDFLVSTRHGQLAIENGLWILTDTNSTNGTYVNGARVQRQVLATGQTITLGTPNAAGSASFRVELDTRAAVGTPASATTPTIDFDAPFAQEPPPSHERITFHCAHCGAVNSAEADLEGQMMACGVCGKQTRVALPPGMRAVQPPAMPPAAGTSPAAAAPGAPGEHGFFGGLIGGVKDKIHRMRERREVHRELTAIESQLPQIETEAKQACAALGSDLWLAGGAAVFGSFRTAGALSEADQAVAKLNADRGVVDQQFAASEAEYQAWLSAFRERFSTEEAEQSAAEQSLTEAQAEQVRAKGAVVAGVASKADLLAALSQKMNELAAEARQEPKDDFWERHSAVVDELNGKIAELREPVPGWADLLAAREAARVALELAIARKEKAVAVVEASKQEKAAAEKAHGDRERAHQQQLAGLATEVERVKSTLPPLHADLGRQYVETPEPPAVNPVPASLTTARAAVDRYVQAYATIAAKKQRLAALDA